MRYFLLLPDFLKKSYKRFYSLRLQWLFGVKRGKLQCLRFPSNSVILRIRICTLNRCNTPSKRLY